MEARCKRPVWLLFKLVELLLSVCCCHVHWTCFTLEGIPHIFLFCATYGAGFFSAVLGILRLFYAERPTMKMEATISGVLGVLNLITVYAYMYLTRVDKRALFYKETEMEDNGLFTCCRDSAILGLNAVSVYFLHCSLAMDMLITHAPSLQPWTYQNRGLKYLRHPQPSKRPLKLYFISRDVEAYLTQYYWFRFLSSSMV
ncbi:CG30184, partial [Drosophila busckii]